MAAGVILLVVGPKENFVVISSALFSLIPRTETDCGVTPNLGIMPGGADAGGTSQSPRIVQAAQTNGEWPGKIQHFRQP
ncbi:unnamed protein product [Linum trigynum]|uniref:Uncharacterized protein n=1 Tax=Linum trigynum TaxID=586398 RepID=A0AAV2E480_9ROSI